MTDPPRLFAYIDETGDRGAGSSSSPIFGMAGVLVDDDGGIALRAAVAQLRRDLNVPSGCVMSWKEHAKRHELRRRAADVLSEVPNMRVLYLYAKKSELRCGSYLEDPQRFYNFVAFRMYKSVLWAARNWKGSSARVWTRFGHVRGHDHTATKSYILREAHFDDRVPSHMEQGLKWVSANQYDESQAADLLGGFLKAAIWPEGRFGYTEPSYLLKVWPRIRNSDTCAIPLGIMSMPHDQVLTEEPWFPCGHCQKRTVP